MTGAPRLIVDKTGCAAQAAQLILMATKLIACRLLITISRNLPFVSVCDVAGNLVSLRSLIQRPYSGIDGPYQNMFP